MARPLVEPAPAKGQRLKMPYEEFLAWADEAVHAEWVDGEVYVFMPPNERHQDLLGFLYTLLLLYVRGFDLGAVLLAPFEMRLGSVRSSRQPDLVFVRKEHAHRLDAQRLDGPGDLVVEVVSDDSVTRDRQEKFAEYAKAGVPEYWILDPRRRKERVEFYRLTPAGVYEAAALDAERRYHSAAVPGFWLDPAWLWQDPLPDELAILETIAPQRFMRSRR